ncbi:MAG TPA: hypothetical protein VKV15_24775 [Bryobacteraceae bacterium]|nr:hypothetical protein [Bryobacteraceae bacterium]
MDKSGVPLACTAPRATSCVGPCIGRGEDGPVPEPIRILAAEEEAIGDEATNAGLDGLDSSGSDP